MRFWFLQLLLASAAVLAVAAGNNALNGKWQLQQNIAGNENTQTCTFTVNGNDLSGSCGTEQTTLKITGKVEDKKVSWWYKTEYNGSPLTVRYTGTIDAQNRITGNILVEEFSADGEFTATQAK